MATHCETCPLHERDLFKKVTPEQRAATQKFKSGEMTIEAGTPILMQGSSAPQLYTALRGMGLRYTVLPNGERQVINFVFPGDFVGLQAGVLGEMQHSVEATTSMTLCVFDRSEFFNFIKTHPDRGYDLTWIAATEEHFLGDTLATVGQRTAMQAVAWALLKMFQRGDALGLVRRSKMPFPFRQQDLADALGLSLVHTNKTLARLRDTQVASWSDKALQVNDVKALADLAEVELEPLLKRPFL
ncbi:Crp/Fnr family transcriptional regulator [Nereida sp. MMG025]|uniref:Crp/Fnr family transcriptional regulator n=1 Tax=Nereida sp. MMG025 TaxID=2909981 RepID=UPI001F237B25|nr:Crp/Fnr family transcriptional regulator [Nereida sp. MMG025]MCF6445846.1 Crp/Fnr family transcriptional regulator [Nereida sp. MMG025]